LTDIVEAHISGTIRGLDGTLYPLYSVSAHSNPSFVISITTTWSYHTVFAVHGNS